MNNLIVKTNDELTRRGYSTVHVAPSEWENTIDVIIIGRNRNPFGASVRQAKFLDDIANITHYDDEGKSNWYSHSKMQQCSSSAISWLIGFAKANPSININLIIK